MKFKVLFILFFSTIIANVNAGEGVLYYKSGFSDIAKNLLLQDFNSGNKKVEASYYLGNIFFNENKIDSAKFYFNEGLKAEPTSAFNNIGLIMIGMNSADPKVLTVTLTKIIKDKLNKKNIAVPIAISYAYLYNKNTAKALEYWDKARSVNSKNADLYMLKGDILASTNLGEACANYETAIFYNKNCKEAYVKYAKVYKSMNPKQAIQKLLELKTISPDFQLVDKELGDIYYATNNFDSAAKHYELYINSGKTTNISDLLQYATTLFFNQKYSKSLEIVKLGLVKNAKNPAFNRLSMYNYVDLKETENALKAADLFFNISDNPIFNFNDYRYYGRALKEAKKFQLAAEQYQKAYKLDTTKVDLWKDVSDMYNEIDSFSNAISAYNTYLSKIPEKQKNDADILVGFAKLYYSLGINKTTTALISKSSLLKSDSIFAIVVALEPEVYRGNFWRARVNSALDPETTQGLAKPFYDKTVAMVEQKNDIRFNSILIECYSYLGYYTLLQKDYTTSLAYWNKILVMDPTNVTAQKAIAGIQAPKKKK